MRNIINWLLGLLGTSKPVPPVQPPVPPVPSGGDFIVWLNALRAQHNLSSVKSDVDMYKTCVANNQQQQIHGLGHYVMGNARVQNAEMGVSVEQAGPFWLTSPPHKKNLLNKNITLVGIAESAPYVTFSGK